jgi:putative flippase GtrA
MSPLLRYWRFNLVGAMGMAVQLGTLALLNHLFPAHYLVVTAAAIELTLLHNFTWHLRYTWQDRHAAVPPQLLRFHLSNGLVSLLGNLLLMRLLVQRFHLPVVFANLVAIVCCSLLNFLLSHRWAFAAQEKPRILRLS